jgi:hypothetical protein
MGPRGRARRAPRAGARRLCRDGRGHGSRRRQSPRAARRARSSRQHARHLHQRQRRSRHQRRLAHLQSSAPRRQRLDL